MRKSVESWQLFWLVALIISVVNVLSLTRTDFRSAAGTTPAILLSVRCALPLFLLAFTASSLATLWPTRITKWLLRNRRFFGLSFAFAMAWHLSFVGYSVFSFGMSSSGLTARGLALDLAGLTFLFLMTMTSFKGTSRRLSIASWRRLHKAGVYVIWFVATYIYLRHPDTVAHVAALSLLLLAWALRMASWAKRRRAGCNPPSP